MKKIINIMAALAATAMCAVPTTTNSANKIGILKFDINSDGVVDSVDASIALKEYTALSCDRPTTFTNTQKYVADANGDQKIDSIDASRILRVYAANSAGNGIPAIHIGFVPTIKRQNSLTSYPAKNDYDEAFEFLMAEKGNDYWSAYMQVMEISDDISIPVQFKTVYRDEKVSY